MTDHIDVLRKFLSAEHHRRLAEREREWPDPLTRDEAHYRKLMGIHRRLMTEALEDARKIVSAHDVQSQPRPREVYIGPRFSASWLPKGLGAFRAYKGSGWRFLQLWRVRFAVKWAYD